MHQAAIEVSKLPTPKVCTAEAPESSRLNVLTPDQQPQMPEEPFKSTDSGPEVQTRGTKIGLRDLILEQLSR